MSELKCQIEKQLDPENLVLTVGERFALRCFGDEVPEKNETFPFKFQSDPADPYGLILLKAESSSKNEIRFEVTSAVVGKKDVATYQLVQGEQKWTMAPLGFEVRSVQDAQNPVQEPYASVGPLGLSVPWYYWAGLVASISLIGIGVSLRVLSKIRRRKKLEQILAMASGANPHAELFANLRRFERSSEFLLRPAEVVNPEVAQKALEDLEKWYGVFLSRIFLIPFLNMSTTGALRTLRREHPKLDPETYRMIQSLLHEIKKSRPGQMTGVDFGQLLEWIKKSLGQVKSD